MGYEHLPLRTRAFAQLEFLRRVHNMGDAIILAHCVAEFGPTIKSADVPSFNDRYAILQDALVGMSAFETIHGERSCLQLESSATREAVSKKMIYTPVELERAARCKYKLEPLGTVSLPTAA